MLFFATVSLTVLVLFVVKLISGRVKRTSATKTVDSDSISGQVEPKTMKFGIHELSYLIFSNQNDTV